MIDCSGVLRGAALREPNRSAAAAPIQQCSLSMAEGTVNNGPLVFSSAVRDRHTPTFVCLFVRLLRSHTVLVETDRDNGHRF